MLGYWRAVAARLEPDDPLRSAYDRMDFVDPESTLSRYLTDAPIEHRAPGLTPIFPFRSNLSQQQAVDNALTRSISVIEGPPGTGKTETILNLIANIVARGGTVGVVSFNNAAVDNVGEKLDEAGFGHMVARLGRRELRDAFFAHQEVRNNRLADLLRDQPGRAPSPQKIADLAGRLRRLQLIERRRARLQAELDAYRLERRHFDGHLDRAEPAEGDRLPLLRGSADRILDFLVETELERHGARPGIIERIRRYFRYGSMRGLDPEDTGVVLELQAAYYDKRIAELISSVEKLDEELRRRGHRGIGRRVPGTFGRCPPRLTPPALSTPAARDVLSELLPAGIDVRALLPRLSGAAEHVPLVADQRGRRRPPRRPRH